MAHLKGCGWLLNEYAVVIHGVAVVMTRCLDMICNLHSHKPHTHPYTIISTSPTAFEPCNHCFYSVGIHPWDVPASTQAHIEALQMWARHPQVVAIGECGIDRLRGGDMEKQIAYFEQHITLSEQVEKPLILHIVKGIDTLLSLYNKYTPKQPWIVHGFRGNATTARQLIEKGISLSYGEKFNPLSVQATPLNMLWVESDESEMPIEEIYERIAATKGMPSTSLIENTFRRAQVLFFQQK